MRKIIQNREFYTTTETSREYCDPGLPEPYPPVRPTNADEIVQSDILIQNKLGNHLYLEPKVNSSPQNRLIPKSMKEPFLDYRAKIIQHWPEILNEQLSLENIKDIINELRTTVYQKSYCTSTSTRISGKDEQNAKTSVPPNWRMDTSYQVRKIHYTRIFRSQFFFLQSSFRSPDEIKQVGVIFPTVPCLPINRDEELAKAMRKIFSFGKTAYQVDYSELGKQYLKQKLAYMDPYS